ncbi:hypothetical protein JS533_000820 [Bifidobacterium amazonense]|uniref:Uncharacterized protein n=1 Tax=Bifidobacterium amazonense TaxID=2809027 RepID=A0ABS9VRW6_9BIFI|nr:hypothetical protein [Bifidobacterium amazonense]MCH9274833.1 hypothetical protein [Bifidobacterium amazonense]
MVVVADNPNFALHQRTIIGPSAHVDPQSAATAWKQRFSFRYRLGTDPLQIAAMGCDDEGRIIEMVAYDAGAYKDRGGNPLRVIFHANYMTDKFMKDFR